MSLSNHPKESAVYLFCPLCQDLYAAPTKYKHLDGCAFGTNPSLLLIVQSPDWTQGLETQWSTYFPVTSSVPAASAADAADDSQAAASPPRPITTKQMQEEYNRNKAKGAAATAAAASSPTSEAANSRAASRQQISGGPANWIYTPRIYGFKVHTSSASGPKMRWLRDKSLVDRTDGAAEPS